MQRSLSSGIYLFGYLLITSVVHQAVCTEAGMFALRERRVHVTQEDFEMAVAKVMKKETDKNMSLKKLWK
jgi:ATP-dependent 26S proteasome regulatory subunit